MELRFKLEDAEKLRRTFDPKKVEKAKRWALNATTRKAATATSRDVRQVFVVKAGTIKKHLDIRKYNRDAGRALLYTGAMLPLAEFKPKTKRKRITATSSRGNKFKTTRRAVTTRVRKDVGRKVVEGGFYAKGKVMRRREQDRNDGAVIPMYGPSIPGLVAHPSTIDAAQDLVRQDLPQQFNDRLEYLLSLD